MRLFKYLGSINRYRQHKDVSFLQSLIKHYIIPRRILLKNIPPSAVVYDIGCGEGILTNYLARLVPKAKFIGVDINKEKIQIANEKSPENAEFRCGDAFNLQETIRADVVILNDVVHHIPYKKQLDFLDKICGLVNLGGKIILKEVDQLDRVDKFMTTYFDKKLYPEDDLSYRPVQEWILILNRLGVYDVEIKKFRSFWPASRTIFIGHASENIEAGYDDKTTEIADHNEKAGDDTNVVFITGGTGFIGRYLVDHLLADGLDNKKVRIILLTRTLDRLPNEYLVNPNIVPLLGDLFDLPRLKKALTGVDYVFHLAAEVKFFQGIDIWRNNFEGTKSVIEALPEVKLKRFVYASTIGAVDRLSLDPCDKPLDENIVPNPLSEYGKSKLEAERAVKESGLDYTIVRIAWAYGKGMTSDTHVRNLFQAVKKRKIFTYFNFPGKVSVIAASDLARVFSFLATQLQASNNVYFAADNEPISLGNLFKSMGDIIDKKVALINIPSIITKIAKKLRPLFPLAVQNLNSDVLCASSRKLISLGFRFNLSKRDGLHVLAKSLGFIDNKLNDSDRFISLVTGAASGIGREIAQKVSSLGHRLLLIDKDMGKLQLLLKDLAAEYIQMDLTKEKSLIELKEYLEKNNFVLDWVFNNAGKGLRGSFNYLDITEQKKIIDLNCTALTYISHLALNHFEKSKRGRIINIASTTAFQPMPFMSVYAGSKAYTMNFSQSLIGELLYQKQVKVLLVIPGGTDTNFQKSAKVKKPESERLLMPDYVANKIIKAIYKNKSIIKIGLRAKIMSFMSKLLTDRYQIKLWRKLMKNMR